MLLDHRPLLCKRRRGRKRPARGQLAQVAENPGVSDRSARNRHAVDAGFVHHTHAVHRGEKVAAPQDRHVGGVLPQLAQERPVAGPGVPLEDRPGMDRKNPDPQLASAVKNPEKLFPAFLRIVQAAPHFDRNRNVGGDRIAHAPHDRQRHFRLAEVKTAAVPAEDLLDRAAEINVDPVETPVQNPPRGRGEFFRRDAHQLRPDRVVVLLAAQKSAGFFASGDGNDELVEHHLADRGRGSMTPRDLPLGPVTHAAQGRLNAREADRDRADFQLRETKPRRVLGGGKRIGFYVVVHRAPPPAFTLHSPLF